MTKVKSQNLSIMMTDIQGYTDTSSQSSREQTVNLIRRHNQLMVPVIEFYGGHIVKSIGDAFLCTFQSATDAVVCAIIIQLLLKDYNLRQKDEHARMKLRVVVNTGDVSLEGNDIYGDAVNITARMEGLPCFPGGSIGISEATHLLMNRNEIVAEKIGPQTLKGIPDPITVYSVPLDKQKLTTIPTRLSQLVERVVSGEAMGGSSGSTTALTAQHVAEFSTAVHAFLKEAKWGEDIANISQKMGDIKAGIAKTFGGPTLVESGAMKTATDAPLLQRLQSFAVDALIVAVACTALWLGWHVVQPMVFGWTEITQAKYSTLRESEQSRWREEQVDGQTLYFRRYGITEELIDVLVRHWVVLVFFYLGIFWKARGATLGQIALKTAVVSETGAPLTWSTAYKRSALFLLSTIFLGLGAATLLTDEKRTLYDKACKTRVIA